MATTDRKIIFQMKMHGFSCLKILLNKMNCSQLLLIGLMCVQRMEHEQARDERNLKAFQPCI